MKKYLEDQYEININFQAYEDIEEIYNYISRDSAYYAIKTKKAIEDRIENLSFIPYMGRRLLGSKNETILNLREIIYKSYRIIYEVDSKNIYVRRVLHSARLLSRNLIKV